MPDLPLITLDTTLTELYKRASPRHGHKRIGQVLCGTNSGIRLNPHFPRNVKFLYQDGPFNTVPKHDLTEDNAELQHSLAMKYLSLVPQRDAFISGVTPVVLFNVSQSPKQIEHDIREAERTVGVLDKHQRPNLVFCPGPGHIPIEEHNIDMIACKLALDQFQQYSTTCDLEAQWFLNSKEALAKSGLPTPKCEIIELDGYAAAAEVCCELCKDADPYFIPRGCRGSRSKWLRGAQDRVLNAILSRSLPFVLKNQQTFGGAGTYIVRTEEERQNLLKVFSNDLLRKLFSQVTADNQHLKAGNILLSDSVTDPIGDYGLTFFVCEDGSAIFLAVSEQMTDEYNAWVGSTINYSTQFDMERKFSPLMGKIASWLHEYGYFGPAGADILETQPANGKSKDLEENLHIVDLNVRTSGSLCLPLLRNHFTSRNLKCASSFGISVESSRSDFISGWSTEFESGRMCILSWYEEDNGVMSIADIAVGGEDDRRLRWEIDRIRATTSGVTF